MKVQIGALVPDERESLQALLQLYIYDFSEILPLEVENDGRFRAPSLQASFADPRSHTFLLRVDDKLAGFALVLKRSYLSGDEAVCDMAELFVMRRHRRRGVGEQLAAWLFDRFAGRWEVRQKAQNHAATAFWRRVIGRYAGGGFEELVLDDERWHGPVQRFDSRTAANQR